MHTPKSLIAATLAVLFLAACGSSGIGDVLGGGTGAGNSNYELRGTVDYVDTSSQSVYLTNVSGYGNMLSNGGSGSSVRVYYDNQTAVEHQGQSHRPEDLERGDEVVVRVDESGNRLMASSIAVTHDVTAGSSLPSPSQTYGSPVRGTVRYIDASRRTIELDRSTGGSLVLDFETNTPVHFNNQSYRVTDLERGDEVEIRVRDLGGNRWIAQDVTVIRSVSGTNNGTWNDNSSSTTRSTIRGTVASIDRSRRTFQLQGANWISGFNTGAGGSSMGTITVQYDDNTSVDVNGALQPMAGLERGDIVDVQVSGSGSSYFAQRLFLVRDINNR
jgi:predicted RNA-binding protein with TRAM domain